MGRRIDISSEDNITIATFKDTKLVDETVINEAIIELTELVSSRQHPRVVISFANVDFLSTTFLGRLISIRKAAITHGTKLGLCSFSEFIMEAVHLVAFEKIFQIYADVDAAVKAMK